MDGVLSDLVKEDRMNPKLFKLFVSCSAAAMSAAVGSFALAQAPAPPPPPPGGASPPPPSAAQPPPAGTEVHLPPHLTTQFASAVRVGDTVTVQGYRSSYVPLIVAASITDANTGQTVVDSEPPPPGSRPPPPPPGMPAPGAQQTTVQGKVQMPRYGPRGDLNGALLADGTIVRIGPMEAYQVASLLNPGQTLAVQGWGLTTSYGKVVEAQAVGPTAGQMVQVAPPVPAYGPAGPPPP